MASVYLNPLILRAISSTAYFTRIDESKEMAEEQEIRKAHPELYQSKIQKFDSPNNIKGIFITTSGIYVETYNGYAVLDKNTGKPKREGTRIRFDKDVNSEWSSAMDTYRQDPRTYVPGQEAKVNYNNNWMFSPVLQNLRYVYFDDSIYAILNNTNLSQQGSIEFAIKAAILNAPGAKGNPTRAIFPRLAHIFYCKELGDLFSNPKGIQVVLEIQNKNRDNWGLELAKLKGKPYVNVSLANEKGWGAPQTDVQGRPDIYMYDRLFLADTLDKQKAEKDEAERKRKEEEQKNKKEGYGIPGFLMAKKLFGKTIEFYLVKPVTNAYSRLLSIGYEGTKQNDGLLVKDEGAIYFGSSKKFARPQQQTRFMLQRIQKGIEESLQNQNKQFQPLNTNSDANACGFDADEFYKYAEQLSKMSNSLIPVNYGFSARLVKGYTCNCKVPAAYKDDMLNESKQKIVNWAGVSFYINEFLKDMVIAQIIKQGMIDVNNIKDRDNDKVASYCEHLRDVFCYGVYVQNQYELGDDNQNSESGQSEKELLQTSVRMCVPADVNLDVLMRDFNNKVPFKVEVKNKWPSDGSQNFSLVYFIVKYEENDDKTMIPATKALEAIKEQGQLPQWSHALLGERDDETPFFWNQFRGSDNTPFKRAYSIYAGSRSGKGILTNTLLCNALANQYKIFYVDGKPDTGISLGHIAWQKGREAFVFDGMRAGSGEHSPGQLEKYSHGLRSANEWAAGFSQIPAGLQEFADLIQTVTTYYRCVELVFDLISYRAGDGKGQLGSPDKDWCVFVIDECAKMADKEKTLRNAFRDYVQTSGAKKMPGTCIPYKPQNVKDESKIIWSAELQFIRNWFDWMGHIGSSINTAITMNLGPSQQNVFFIFQGQSWMKDAKETLMVSSLMQIPTTKILGRGSIEPGASGSYGNAQTMKLPWASYIEKPLQWVITTKQNVNTCMQESDVRKFRPYSLWGNTEAQMLGGEQDTYRNIQYYVRELEETFGFDAAAVLESAFTYADGYTKSKSGLDVKNYVYGLSFLTNGGSSDIREISESELPIADLDTGRRQTTIEPADGFSLNTGQNSSDTYLDMNEPPRPVQPYSQFADDDNYGTKVSKEAQKRAQQLQDQRRQAWEQNHQGQMGQGGTPRQFGQGQIGVGMGPNMGQMQNPEKFEQARMINPGYVENENGTPVIDENYESTEVLNNENARKTGKNQGLFSRWIRSKIPNNPVGKDGFFQAVQYDLMIGGQILYEIQNAAGASQRVADLGLVNNRVYVNKKLLSFADEMTNPAGEIDLANCIKFKKLFGKFKRMQHLHLDSEMYDELLTEYEKYGEERLRQIFKESRKLIDIEVFDKSGKSKIVQRGEALRTPYKESDRRKVEKALTSDAKKTRDKMKSSGFFSRAGQALGGVKEEAWGTPGKRALTTVTTIATVGFLGLAAGPIVLLGAQFLTNYAVRKMSGSMGKN